MPIPDLAPPPLAAAPSQSGGLAEAEWLNPGSAYAANASPERLTSPRALGAELILSNPLEGPGSAIRTAHRPASGQPERFIYTSRHDSPARCPAPETPPFNEGGGLRPFVNLSRNEDRRQGLDTPLRATDRLLLTIAGGRT